MASQRRLAAFTLAITTMSSSLTLAQGGEDIGSAVDISVPSTKVGTTVGYQDDADEACPYTGSSSPDVFYRYTNPTDEAVRLELSLCGSGYDTKIYVYDATMTLIELVDGSPACNDDFCMDAGGFTFRSYLRCVLVAPGMEVFIVIDGWAGDAGQYQLVAGLLDPVPCEPPFPCVVPCPTGATLEGEPCDFGNPAPDDSFNGGCNSSTPETSFFSVQCEETVCGQSYFDGSFRDTDWFELDTSGDATSTTFVLSGLAQFASICARVENLGGAVDCSKVTVFASFEVNPRCVEFTLETPRLDPGLYWFFLGTDFTEIIDCNQPETDPGPGYLLTFGCQSPCPWDLDGDLVVGFGDLLSVLSNWGPCSCPEDFDGDLLVGFGDLLAVLSNWGACK